MVEFEIANVVGTITYQQEFDLSELAETFEQRDEINSVTYEPAKNHWLQTRFAPNNTYVPYYRSGKCSIVGARSPERFTEMAERVKSLMDELLDIDYEPTTEITNIVATAELEALPPLEAVTLGLGLENTEYEPEQFPAIIYRGEKAVVLIFSSGKLVCTGLTDLNKIQSEIDGVAKQIGEFPTS